MLRKTPGANPAPGPHHWRSYWAWVALATAAILAVLIVGFITLGGSRGSKKPLTTGTSGLASGAAVASPSPSPSATASVAPSAAPAQSPSAIPSARPSPLPSVPPTLAPCLNSDQERCGPFRWDPAPAPKAPVVIDVQLQTASPKAGQPVSYAVHVTHAQELIDTQCGGGSYGDGLADPRRCSEAVCLPRFGPWVPPAPKPGDFQRTYQHTYASPGTYRVTFTFITVPSICDSPYASRGTASITITVT